MKLPDVQVQSPRKHTARIIFWIVFLLLSAATLFGLLRYQEKLHLRYGTAPAEYAEDGRRLMGCLDQYGDSMSCKKCLKKGRLFENFSGVGCVIPAKDGGKRCLYNEDCTYGICIYESKDAASGVCNTFPLLNDPLPLDTCNRFNGLDVGCGLPFSVAS